MQKVCFKSVAASFLLGVLAMMGARASAQSVRGVLAGTITDSAGAVVPGASVTAVSEDNGARYTAKTTGVGTYRFPDIAIGRYTLTVSAGGFKTAVNRGVLVQINTTSALDVSISNGAVNETVTVDASEPQIETQSAEMGGTVSQKQIEDLPISLSAGVGGLRSPETFEFLIPGTTGPGSTRGSDNGVFFARLAGGQAYGNETLLDGASIQRSENGSSFDETSPSIEALQEFKVTTSTPSAEFGRTTSGITSFSTRSGTNSFHGIALAIVKNAAFDANNWFNNGYKALRCGNLTYSQCVYVTPKDSKYEFGGTFNGPVIIPHLYNGHDKTFFEFAWEQFRFTPSAPVNATVPTAAERMGNFADVLGGPVPGGSTYPGVGYTVLLNPCTGTPVLYNQIFDPRTSQQIAPGIFCRTPFQGNAIPQSLISTTATKFLAGLPLPNQTPLGTDVFGFNNNYAVTSKYPNFNTTYTIRIDQNISDRDKVFASYDTRQNFKQTLPQNFPGNYNSNGYPQLFTTHYSRAGWDYTFTPAVLNHLNLGYNRTNSRNFGASAGTSQTAGSFGVPGDFSKFFPQINFPSPDQPTTFGQQQNGLNVDNGIRVNDIVTWIKGRNSFKFGGEARWQQYSAINDNQDSFNFYRDQTAALNFACCGSGNPVASLLAGEVGSASQNVYNENPRWNSHYDAVFVQDDIRMTKNLTVNVGIRYDVDVPRHEALNRTSELSLTAPDAAAGGLPGALVFGTNCKCNTAWADTWFKDISPRIGFAYVLPGTNNKVVLRGGGALLYGPLQYSDFGGSMQYGYNQSRNFNAVQNNAANTGGAFTPAFRLDSSSLVDPTNPSVGFPNVSYAPNLDPAQLTAQNGPGSFNAVGGQVILPQNGRPSMTDNWSLQLQDELAKDLIFTIGYIGQEAQNLHSGFLSNINNISPAYFGLGDKLGLPAYNIPQGGVGISGQKAPYSTFTGALGQALRPFPQYDFIAGDCCLENLGHSSYHAMVVSLARRFRDGVNLQASYTWQKTLTDADAAIPFSYVTGNGGNGLRQGEGSTNLRSDKAVSAQNIPQTFSLSYIYELPFGKGRKFLGGSNHYLDLLIGGWQVSGIQRYQSGLPISFGCATGIPFYQNCITYNSGPASSGGTDYASAAYKRNKNGPSTFNQQSWFKPAYRVSTSATDPGVSLQNAAFVDENNPNGPNRRFTPACAAQNGNIPCSFDPFTLGNIPRVTEAFTGPNYLAEDLSLQKNFHIAERYTFQLRVDVFDAFNRHRMGLPDTSPGDFQSTSMGFGIPTFTDYGPRNMQLNGRFYF